MDKRICCFKRCKSTLKMSYSINRIFICLIWLAMLMGNSLSAEEILKTKDGKQILIKDNFTWEYLPDQKPSTVKYAEDAVTIWDKVLLRQDSDYEKQLGLFLHYQNNTHKKVIGLIVKVNIMNPFGKVVLNTTFEDEVSLQPNERQKNEKFWVFKDNPFINDEPYDRMWNMADNGTAKITAKVLKVIFDDGTTLSAKSATKQIKP